MYNLLNINTWNRREHFEFFNRFDEPFFGITAELDFTKGYDFCKANSIPFFLYYHYQSILAVNKIEEFRYRIKEEEILIYDPIHVTATISRTDNTFSFSFIPFTESFEEFCDMAKMEIEKIRKISGLGLTEDTGRLDVIHFSTVPWISFTGVTHARNFKVKDSIPKITFGKYFRKNDKIYMPISVNVHHGLMDGYHVGKYLQLVEHLMNDV